jgi:hypothetical protein
MRRSEAENQGTRDIPLILAVIKDVECDTEYVFSPRLKSVDRIAGCIFEASWVMGDAERVRRKFSSRHVGGVAMSLDVDDIPGRQSIIARQD